MAMFFFTKKGDWWWLFEIVSLRCESFLNVVGVGCSSFSSVDLSKASLFFRVNPFRFILNYSSMRMSYKQWGTSKIIHRSSPPKKRYKISWHQRNLGSIILLFYVHKGYRWWTKIRLAAILSKRPHFESCEAASNQTPFIFTEVFFGVVVPQKWVGLS